MKIATWNVNSIKARMENVQRWLALHNPDILMIQELKGLDFPATVFEEAGYRCAAVPQKTYNGVATLSRHPIEILREALPGDESDEQARYLEIETGGIRLINIYAPNGNPAPGDKFDYKLRWLDRLRRHLGALRQDGEPFIIGGDFNVIPEPQDCYDPGLWKDDALFRIESRQALRAIMNLGLTDALRVHNRKPAQYTFWDYQGGAWPANKGIRIDHFLLSPAMADRLVSCTIDTEPRGWDKASDHTPVVVEISS